MRANLLFVMVFMLCLSFTLAFAGDYSGSVIARAVVFPDTSGSLESMEFRAACERVADVISRLCRSARISELAVLPWASSRDCQESPHWRVSLPLLGKTTSPETQLTDAERLFRRVSEHKLQRAERLEVREQDRLNAEHHRSLEPKLKQFREQVMAGRQGRASCTAVGAMLERCSMESPTTLAVVITDGIEECRALSGQPLPAGARTVIVLVPSKGIGERGNPDPEVLCRQIKARAPWALIIPSFRLADSTIDWERILLGQDEAIDKDSQPASAVVRSEGLR